MSGKFSQIVEPKARVPQGRYFDSPDVPAIFCLISRMWKTIVLAVSADGHPPSGAATRLMTTKPRRPTLKLSKTTVLDDSVWAQTYCTIGNLSNPKPGHTTGGSRRGARRGGGAGSGRTVRQQNCSPREQSFPAPPKASKTRRLNVSPEAQTSEIGHITGGSGRGARRSGQAGSGKIACQRKHSPRKQKSTVPSKKKKSLQHLSRSTNKRNPM